MSAATRLAGLAAKAVFCSSLLALVVWLVWFGQYKYAGFDCQFYRPNTPGATPAGWVTGSACAFNWSRPVIPANLGFLFLVPVAAALSAIAVIALREHGPATDTRSSQGVALLQSWLGRLLPPKRLWLWWCDGLTVKDGLLLLLWAAYNAIWFVTILNKSFDVVLPQFRSVRLYAKAFASLMMPNLMVLLFPVSRGSVISNALSLSYPEGIRYHRWLGQWVLLLTCSHGLIYWISWAAQGRWLVSAWRPGQETNNILGGVALMFALLLWATSQEVVRRQWYSVYKTAHHIGFWGFMVLGCAHHWALWWYFVPGMLLYAVDGVFRLHQVFAGRSGDLVSPQHDTAAAKAAAASTAANNSTVSNTEVLQVDVSPSGTMVSLLLSAPDWGMAPAGIVWLNVPALSAIGWHPFDYTASRVVVGPDGRLCNSNSNRGDSGESVKGGSVAGQCEGQRQVTALSVHIKAYNRWTKDLITKLAQGGEHKLSIRMQGPYADPPVPIGHPEGVVLVAGGNGIASALPVLEELSAEGVATKGLPALLVWACRRGFEFEHMAAPVLAAAEALGLNLTVRLHVTDGAQLTSQGPGKGVAPNMPPAADISDTQAVKDTNRCTANTTNTKINNSTATTNTSKAPLKVPVKALSTASTSSASSGSDAEEGHAAHAAAAAGEAASAAPTSLCPVVAFASFAAQLSFKTLLHVAVFAGFLFGFYITTLVGVAQPVAAGRRPWETSHLGPALVLIPAACAVGCGLIVLWTGLFIQRRQGRVAAAAGVTRPAGGAAATGPAAAVAAASGTVAQLLPAGQLCGKGTGAAAGGAPAYELQVPSLAAGGDALLLPVVAGRPAVSDLIRAWLAPLQQLPAAAGRVNSSSGSNAGSLQCVVYGCGPTTLDHDTQMAVAALQAGKSSAHGSGSRPLLMQFVRKAQQL